MFCNQCEQTSGGSGCTDLSTCGKDPDIQSLQETLLYGLKGMAAYAHHARRLGRVDEEVDAFMESALFATMTNVNFDFDSLLEMVLECGRVNLRVMEMLDAGNADRFGVPTPCTVYEGTKGGPGILVTGHDLLDLSDLLEQAAGTGVHVYTHGEMLPAHSYPKLRAHEHLAGHFGTAWQNQNLEFTQFSGPIVATTNCVMLPWPTYKDRLYTTRITAVPGGTRLRTNDFSRVIEQANACPPLPDRRVGESTIGFNHRTVLGLSDTLIQALKSGTVKQLYLIGGCDGAKSERSYYTEVARSTPHESIMLTVGCGKYRIRGQDYGEVAGLPRLLDMGQCNDAFSAIQVAVGLARELNCSVNDLPLTLVISWYEQKAVAVLLTMLYLGIKGIRIGPSAPAFMSPKVFEVLQEKFDLKLIESEPPRELFEFAKG